MQISTLVFYVSNFNFNWYLVHLPPITKSLAWMLRRPRGAGMIIGHAQLYDSYAFRQARTNTKSCVRVGCVLWHCSSNLKL